VETRGVSFGGQMNNNSFSQTFVVGFYKVDGRSEAEHKKIQVFRSLQTLH